MRSSEYLPEPRMKREVKVWWPRMRGSICDEVEGEKGGWGVRLLFRRG